MGGKAYGYVRPSGEEIAEMDPREALAELARRASPPGSEAELLRLRVERGLLADAARDEPF